MAEIVSTSKSSVSDLLDMVIVSSLGPFQPPTQDVTWSIMWPQRFLSHLFAVFTVTDAVVFLRPLPPCI